MKKHNGEIQNWDICAFSRRSGKCSITARECGWYQPTAWTRVLGTGQPERRVNLNELGEKMYWEPGLGMSVG